VVPTRVESENPSDFSDGFFYRRHSISPRSSRRRGDVARPFFSPKTKAPSKQTSSSRQKVVIRSRGSARRRAHLYIHYICAEELLFVFGSSTKAGIFVFLFRALCAHSIVWRNCLELLFPTDSIMKQGLFQVIPRNIAVCLLRRNSSQTTARIKTQMERFAGRQSALRFDKTP
jgi:hypothetical protein